MTKRKKFITLMSWKKRIEEWIDGWVEIEDMKTSRQTDIMCLRNYGIIFKQSMQASHEAPVSYHETCNSNYITLIDTPIS